MQKAIAEFERMLSESTTRPEWMQVGLLTGAYTSALDLPRGIRFFEQFLATRPDNRIRLALAILENARGNRARALGLLDAVTSSEPPGTDEAISAAALRQSYLNPPKEK
jgi:hypothetical protein